MTGLELRTEGDGTIALSGLASRSNTTYRVGRGPLGFDETIRSGAFRQSLSRPDLDVTLMVQHDPLMALARTPGTLKLYETGDGLRFDARLDPADPLAQQTVRRVERGVLRECSFAFRTSEGGDTWSADRKQRTVTNADIHRGDVSLVIYGANAQTGAQISPVGGTEAERAAVARAVSTAGWFGPAVKLSGDVRTWANQHGKSCETCDGSGDCPDCGGQGWTSTEEDGDDDEQLAASGRRLALLEAELMQMRLAPPEPRIYRPAASPSPDTSRATEALLRRWGVPQLSDWG